MAYRWGLVHKVAPAARTEEAALQLAAQVAEHPPEAVARLKRMLHELGRRRGPLARRGRGPGRLGSDRPGASLPRLSRPGMTLRLRAPVSSALHGRARG